MDFYNKFVNDVETIANRFEEGISLIMNAENPVAQSEELQGKERMGHGNEAFSEEEIAGLDEDELREMLQEHGNIFEASPLEGIADGVIQDIMKNKVNPDDTISKI